MKLTLPQDTVYDFGGYKGTERTRRERSRAEAEAAKLGGGAVSLLATGLAALAPVEAKGAAYAGSAASTTTTIVGVAAPGVAVAASGQAPSLPPPPSLAARDRMAWYTQKLHVLVQRLEQVVAPPDDLVRSFWAELDEVERARFYKEFPQCMVYIPGWQAQLPAQLRR